MTFSIKGPIQVRQEKACIFQNNKQMLGIERGGWYGMSDYGGF